MGILLGLLGGEEKEEDDDDEILMQKIPTHMKCDVLLTTYNSPLLSSFLPSIPSHPILSRPLSHQPSSLSLPPPCHSTAIKQSPQEDRTGHKPPYQFPLPPNKQRKEKIKTNPERKIKSRRKNSKDLFLPSHPYSDNTDNTDTPKNTFRVPRFFGESSELR